ncbi:ABC transporter ATP-binding protein [Longimicrobium terrae]|uniref:ATP-binding cassette subfamily B protein n=1 Tax=Longimicrobium terrae TaxID=1639882 RepID=A0A841H6D9_9BACT|nr:ABC transporter ATP-binding protein [Longimicrobium terrae]MBB4638184.1 ATP-binding cassette subfamily B protein [Longimicrobium terrae]MBB6073657.1 ATP-binding cassette subfamily B protein [Longimicrobium terrae]NNC30335.1 ABC transporter ATP-binding protein [Longimicrobium terrae]
MAQARSHVGQQRRSPTEGQPTWRQRLRAMRNLPPFMGMVWRTHRGYVLGIAALRLLRAFVPIATLWIGKLIVDEVVAAAGAGTPDWRRISSLVALEFGIVVVGEVAARTGTLLESLLGDLFSNRLSVQLMEHAADLDLQHFEDPVFYDRLERARRQTVGRIALLAQMFGLAQDALTLVTLIGTLLAFSPLLFVLLVLTVLPSFLGETHFAALGYSLLYQWTPERRRLDYYRMIGASDTTAKEVKLFGLSPFLVAQYRLLSDQFYAANRSLAIRRSLVSTALTVVSTLGYYAAYGTIVYRTVLGRLTLGSLTLLAGTFSRSRDLIQRMLLSTTDLYEQALYLDDLFTFLAMQPTIRRPDNARPFPRPIRQGFEFRDVWFRYPGTGDDADAPANPPSDDPSWVLRGISLRIAPGERLALVGENGAGKTTITKLLTRLYEPTRGVLLLDGHPLGEYDPAELYDQAGVIFQDFVRYDMTAEENIAVGRIGELAAGGDDEHPRVVDAARRSLASEVVEALPARYRQMLGRRFEGGVDLSGGQWQKVALGRAYMRDAQLLILDEPTAALDARAEYEVFQRFTELTDEKMAILISHRFSTVRMADRIIVLEHGRVLEEGTHDELLALGGRYAELFNLQAAGYR